MLLMGADEVLIETLWNVKGCSIWHDSCQQKCINRNIVECKVNMFVQSISRLASINRNIVECKEILCFMCFTQRNSINRNIVECKE